MVVQRIALGENPLRQALAYNRNQLAAVAVGIVEIASFEDRQAKCCEKCWRDDSKPRVGMFLGRRRNVPVGRKFEVVVVIGSIAPRNGGPDSDVLNVGQFTDSQRR